MNDYSWDRAIIGIVSSPDLAYLSFLDPRDEHEAAVSRIHYIFAEREGL